jgi:hypothetical protein
MPGARQQNQATEKLPLLIGIGLEREYMSADDISAYFDCSRRTASRLMLKLYDMRHDLRYLKVEQSGSGNSFDKLKMKIRLNKKWS